MTGTLGLFSLVDLFQLLAASSRSGRLTVDHPEGAARVYFEEGLAVHAEFAGRSGEEAVFALFANEQGSFEFMLGVPAPQTTIESRTENLVLEASRRLDESRRGEGSEQGQLGTAMNRESVEHGPSQPRPKAANASPPASSERAAPPQRPSPRPNPQPNPQPSPQPKSEAVGPSPTSGDDPELLQDDGHTEKSEPRRQGPVEAKPRERAAAPPTPGPPAKEAPAQTVTTTGSGSGITLTAIPAFAEKAKTVADMSLSQEEVEFLRGVDGKRNVGQIAQETSVVEERARAIVDRFVELGVLRLSNRKPRTARLVTHLTRTRLPHGVVGVDPSIMNAWERSLGYPAVNIACRREDGRVCLLGAMPLDNAGPFLMINRETLMHADLAVNQPLLVKPVPQNAV